MLNLMIQAPKHQYQLFFGRGLLRKNHFSASWNSRAPGEEKKDWLPGCCGMSQTDFEATFWTEYQFLCLSVN